MTSNRRTRGRRRTRRDAAVTAALIAGAALIGSTITGPAATRILAPGPIAAATASPPAGIRYPGPPHRRHCGRPRPAGLTRGASAHQGPGAAAGQREPEVPGPPPAG